MENETFKSRVSNLLARSRKALRLYSNVGNLNGGNNSSVNRNSVSNNYSDMQATQWRDITADLLKDLSSAAQKNQSVKNLSAEIFTIRDKFNSIWRSVEAEMHLKHKELISLSESGDFVKAAIVSSGLVSAKARYQASQAAHHELEELIKSSHYASEPIVLTHKDVLEEQAPYSPDDAADEKPQKSVANLSRNSFAVRSGSKPAKVIPIRKVL